MISRLTKNPSIFISLWKASLSRTFPRSCISNFSTINSSTPGGSYRAGQKNQFHQRTGGQQNRYREVQETNPQVKAIQNKWSQEIDHIFQQSLKQQSYQLKELIEKCQSSKREILVSLLSSSQYRSKVLQLYKSQLHFFFDRGDDLRILREMKNASLLEDFFFASCPEECAEFNDWTNSFLKKIQNNDIQLLTLSKIYQYLLRLYPTNQDYFETAQLITNLILDPQSQLPDNAKITHYARYKHILSLKESDVILKNNDKELKLILRSIKLLDPYSDSKLLAQLNSQASEFSLDLQTLSVQLTGEEWNDEKNLLTALEDIKTQKVYTLTPQNLANIYLSLGSIAKHLLLYLGRQERMQALKNLAATQQTYKPLSYYSNCSELVATYLTMPYTEKQQQCLKVFLGLAKQILLETPSIEQQIEQQSVLNCQQFKLSMFYQISKIQGEFEENFLDDTLKFLIQMEDKIKGQSLVNAFSILANYSLTHKQEVQQFLEQHSQTMLQNLHFNKIQTNFFSLVYCAYLSSEILQNKKVQATFLDVLEERLSTRLTDFHNVLLSINYLESMDKSDSRLQEILNKLIGQTKLKEISVDEIKNTIVRVSSVNKVTLGFCLDWFQKNIDQLKPTDVSFFLHRFKKLQASHLLRQNEKLMSKLNSLFIQNYQKSEFLMIEYRRNALLTNELLDLVEKADIQDLQNKKTQLPKGINQFYNMTRLRLASPVFLQLLIDLTHTSQIDLLQFSDYMKLLKSLGDQEVSEGEIIRILQCLETKLQKKEILLEKQSLQLQRLFYVCLKQYNDLSSLPIIKKFLDNGQFENSYQEPEIDNTEELNYQVDVPYNHFIEQALQQMGISFEREKRINNYKVDYFLPTEKTCIELNGDLHYFGNALTPPTQSKVKFLSKYGFKVIQVNQREWKNRSDISTETILSILKEQLQQKTTDSTINENNKKL